jgi:hypothetical protein
MDHPTVSNRIVGSGTSMSGLGQKQTFAVQKAMSALPPKADIGTQSRNVRFVPQPDSCSAANTSSFDHLVGARE